MDLAEIGITSSEAAERCGTSEKWASNILKAHEAWQATGDLDAVRRASSLRPGFFSLMMNRGGEGLHDGSTWRRRLPGRDGSFWAD
nr:hypothetical protein [Halomonas socia]